MFHLSSLYNSNADTCLCDAQNCLFEWAPLRRSSVVVKFDALSKRHLEGLLSSRKGELESLTA
jgi:hypothetical protein